MTWRVVADLRSSLDAADLLAEWAEILEEMVPSTYYCLSHVVPTEWVDESVPVGEDVVFVGETSALSSALAMANFHFSWLSLVLSDEPGTAGDYRVLADGNEDLWREPPVRMCPGSRLEVFVFDDATCLAIGDDEPIRLRLADASARHLAKESSSGLGWRRV